MKIIITPTFKRAAKKLHPNQKNDLKDAIDALSKDPKSGEEKKGDLEGTWVYKFRMVNQLALLAYTYDEIVNDNNGNVITEDVLTLIYAATHENFYRDLKKKK